MSNRIITNVVLQGVPTVFTPAGMLEQLPRVIATFNDNTTKTLFEYYPDELSFTEQEFIGLTERQAHDLRHAKDVAYLQS